MRILVLSEKYFPQGGGAEFATHLILELLSRYYDITLVSTANARPPDRVRLVSLPLQRERLKGHLISLLLLSRLKRLIKNHDVVYVPRTCYLPISLAKKLAKKVIVHLHDYYSLTHNAILWLNEQYNSFPQDLVHYSRMVMGHTRYCVLSMLPCLLNNVIDRNLIRYADVIVCPSKFHLNILSKLLGNYQGKLVHIYNPLPNDLLDYKLTSHDIKRKHDEKIFTYVGPAKAYKGFHAAVKIFKDLNVRCRFIGISDKNVARSLKKLIPSVEIYPRLPRSEYLRLLLESYAVVLPFLWQETFSYNLIEACLLGNLPIVRKIGVSEEFFNIIESSKFLFEDEEEALAKVNLSLSMSIDNYFRIIREQVFTLRNLINNKEIEERWKKLLENIQTN